MVGRTRRPRHHWCISIASLELPVQQLATRTAALRGQIGRRSGRQTHWPRGARSPPPTDSRTNRGGHSPLHDRSKDLGGREELCHHHPTSARLSWTARAAAPTNGIPIRSIDPGGTIGWRGSLAAEMVRRLLVCRSSPTPTRERWEGACLIWLEEAGVFPDLGL